MSRGQKAPAELAASSLAGFECVRAGHRLDGVPRAGSPCPRCADQGAVSSLRAVYDTDGARRAWHAREGRGIWRYAGLLPIRDSTARIDLGAGSTPMLPWTSDDETTIWLKNESLNPTWSYKDRLATVGVSAAVEAGAETVIASSTGNHGAATAAAAAAAGLKSVVLTRPETSPVTLTFLQSLGAKVFVTSPKGRWSLVEQAVTQHGWYPMSGYSRDALGSPHGIEGHKSLAFEVVETLGHAPELVVVPSCYGEGLAGIWEGFAQLRELGVSQSVPAMLAVEPAGGGPLTRTLRAGAERVMPVDPYSTVAASIAGTSSSDRALAALHASGGSATTVTDEAMLEAQAQLGRQGMFVEAAAAAGLAAVSNWAGLARSLNLPPEGDVVVVLTGGGLRTADSTASRLPSVREVVPDAAGLATIVSAAS